MTLSTYSKALYLWRVEVAISRSTNTQSPGGMSDSVGDVHDIIPSWGLEDWQETASDFIVWFAFCDPEFGPTFERSHDRKDQLSIFKAFAQSLGNSYCLRLERLLELKTQTRPL